MATEPLARARAHLGEVVDRARHGGQPTILTDHGKPAAVVISPEMYDDYRRLQEAEITRVITERVADDAPRRVFSSVDEMMREAGLA